IFENDLGWPYWMRYNYFPSFSQALAINDTAFLFTLNTWFGLEGSIGNNKRVVAMDTSYQELWRLFNEDGDFLYDRHILRIGRLNNQNFLGIGTKRIKS